MYKIKAVALDLIGNAKEWLDAYGDEDRMEICEIITLDDDSPIPIGDLPQYDNWDVLLVFEEGLRDLVNKLIAKLSIPRDKVIFPMDMEDENAPIASYIFRGAVRRLLEYYSNRPKGHKYTMCDAEGLTYVNVASDRIILPTMILEQTNWAKEEMVGFYRLACEHFSFSDKQTLFCDIGANIGTTCIYFKKRLDENLKILAFEPSPQNYKMLNINAMLNDLDESEYMFVRKGLAEKAYSAGFSYNPSNPGASNVVAESSNNGDTIELVSFDEYIETNGIDPGEIKYLWIDVEGFEARFLAGARNTLGKINAPILMEFTPMFYAKREGEFDLLISEIERNYSRFICMQDEKKEIQPIKRLLEERDNMDLQWDLFLLK